MNAKDETVTYARYFGDASRCLNFFGQAILKSPKNTILGKKGRDASTAFEKKIALPAINEEIDNLVKQINEEFSKENINTRIVSISLDLTEQNEAQKRSWFDFSFTLKIEESEYLIPVNIKYTSGLSKDNIGGWPALAFSLFGEVNKTKGFNGVLNSSQFKNGDWKTAAPSDYFILSFTHGEHKATESFNIGSLLSLSESERAYNTNQAFPVQARISSAERTIEIAAEEARFKFLKWLSGKNRTKIETDNENSKLLESTVESYEKSK